MDKQPSVVKEEPKQAKFESKVYPMLTAVHVGKNGAVYLLEKDTFLTPEESYMGEEINSVVEPHVSGRVNNPDEYEHGIKQHYGTGMPHGGKTRRGRKSKKSKNSRSKKSRRRISRSKKSR